MSMEIIILSVSGAAVVAGISFFIARWHYRPMIRTTTEALVDCQSVNQEQKLKLASLEQARAELEDQCKTFVTTVALSKQEIGHQQTRLAEFRSEQEQLSAKLDTADGRIKALTAERAELESSRGEKIRQVGEHKKNADNLRDQLDQANGRIAALEADSRERQAILTAEEDKLVELKAQFEQQKTQLKNEFKVISEEIIHERQRMLHEQNKEGVGALLKPLREQLVSFQQRVNEVHTETVKGNSSLGAEIKKVVDIGLRMRDDASNLTAALKGNAQQRGAWGEAQLERTLEMSGLVKDAHYAKQSSLKDREGRHKLTDYLIKLPDNKHIIIDSKVSLIAYDKALAAATEAEQMAAMNEHVKAVKKHIDELAAKDYTNLMGIHSPDFVLMFLPIEPAYIEALKHSKELFGYGYDKNIVLVSHTTLIPILRTIANLWVLDQSNHEARKISDKAGEIYNSVCTLAERLQKLGNALNTVGNHYNDTVKAVSGRQGLQGKVERFTQISNKVSKKMPELRAQTIDCETASLAIQPLAVEQVGEEVEGKK